MSVHMEARYLPAHLSPLAPRVISPGHLYLHWLFQCYMLSDYTFLN